ncbi:hypothetical protein ACFL4B_04090, partial [Candidatus Neomarinimicrobiota bacterium]
HQAVDCYDCHKNDSFQNINSDCVSCHQSEYVSVSDPNHQVLGFSTVCEECHTTNPGWTPVNIDHSVFYPLIGGHSLVQNDCSNCHANGYNNTTDQCFSCHKGDFNTITNPNHQVLGFSTDCEECHTTNPGWTPVTIDHSIFFPLLGGHNLVKDDCTRCHSSGYTNTSTNCVDCHLADYNGTTDPDHSSAQFPQDCDQCHTTDPDWSPSTFDHDGFYFPIFSGDHRNKWDNCSTCHFNPSNYSEFYCLSCHSENGTRQKHTKDGILIDGYVWDSYACYDCHPNGSEE